MLRRDAGDEAELKCVSGLEKGVPKSVGVGPCANEKNANVAASALCGSSPPALFRQIVRL